MAGSPGCEETLASPRPALSTGRLGLYIFLASYAIVFATLVMVVMILRSNSLDWPPPVRPTCHCRLACSSPAFCWRAVPCCTWPTGPGSGAITPVRTRHVPHDCVGPAVSGGADHAVRHIGHDDSVGHLRRRILHARRLSRGAHRRWAAPAHRNAGGSACGQTLRSRGRVRRQRR